jgi:hypothetical protein
MHLFRNDSTNLILKINLRIILYLTILKTQDSTGNQVIKTVFYHHNELDYLCRGLTIDRNKKLRTHEVTKATPATQLMPAQRPRRRRDKIVGGADH